MFILMTVVLSELDSCFVVLSKFKEVPGCDLRILAKALAITLNEFLEHSPSISPDSSNVGTIIRNTF